MRTSTKYFFTFDVCPQVSSARGPPLSPRPPHPRHSNRMAGTRRAPWNKCRRWNAPGVAKAEACPRTEALGDQEDRAGLATRGNVTPPPPPLYISRWIPHAEQTGGRKSDGNAHGQAGPEDAGHAVRDGGDLALEDRAPLRPLLREELALVRRRAPRACRRPPAALSRTPPAGDAELAHLRA